MKTNQHLSHTMKDIQYDIKLRPTVVDDLETLFQFQLDDEANHLAAFTSKDSTNKEAYIAKFTKLLADPTVNNQTIIVDTVTVGSIAKFIMEGDAEITYWIDKNFWGKGIATNALKGFLAIETARPIFGRVAFDNLGSQKVLEKCGFVKIGTDKGFANARQTEIEEFIYRLDD
ncbi:GNAT family N-acetyltransferase [Chryseobacterium sp. T20]|uniref:GNAT family N-acetyltransferase n=1 Tax=Chryseobacterium sp. T20 TaxID=3395375 RepID=UPI0039BC9E24